MTLILACGVALFALVGLAGMTLYMIKEISYKYRLRLGKYRFLYEIIEEQILIYAYKASSRGDIYK